jgi:hypothetical protein
MTGLPRLSTGAEFSTDVANSPFLEIENLSR